MNDMNDMNGNECNAVTREAHDTGKRDEDSDNLDKKSCDSALLQTSPSDCWLESSQQINTPHHPDPISGLNEI